MFSEKPFALSLKRANKLVKLAQKKNKTFLVGYMKRCDDGIKILKNEINKISIWEIIGNKHIKLKEIKLDTKN